MHRIFNYLSKTKKETILAPLFKMLEVVFELLVPIIVTLIIDKGINEDGDSNIVFIILMCLLLLLFGILGLCSSVTAQYFAAVASSKLQTSLRVDLFKKINSLEYKELDNEGTSTLITKMTSDVNQVVSGVNMTLRLLLRSPIVIIGAVIVAFTFSMKAGLAFLITVPVLFLLIFLIMIFTIPLFKKTQQKLDIVVRSTRENLNGVRVIRAFNKQNDEINKFDKQNQELKKYQLFVGKISNIINPLTYALINIFIIVLIYLGALDVNVGTLDSGAVVGLYNLASQILVEMVKFANLLVTISKAMASDKRIEQVFSIESNLKYLKENDEIDSQYLYVFDDVSLSYNGKEKVLEHISFNVKKGEMVGIIGGTGSGKTSLVNLLGHFYDIDDGKIYYQNKNILNYDIKSLREHISLVPQKAQLFQGTIKENLTMGRDVDENIINQALTISQSLEVIKNKKDGIDSFVEQDGRNLSGGQKQRLTIARALIKNGDILILDDSSSALDYKTESQLRNELRKIKDKTIFIVSQRASSLLSCDKVIVLDQGKIESIGTPQELLKNSKIYREIYSTQFKDMEAV